MDMYTKRAYYKNQIYTFGKYIGLSYRSMGTSIKFKGGFYGDGLLSRFPIEFSANFLSPLFHQDSEQRGILYNKISFGTTKLNLFSIHLSTFEDERIEACKELLRITDKISRNEGIIIGGDFNVGITKIGKHKYRFDEKESYEEYELLKERFNSIENTKPTWTTESGSGCIDTIFYSKNLKLSKHETIDTDTSDHSAVYAEFII